ncbi:MAG: hypothetical protein DMG76_23725 [Acidobacteria bacterium]|nr:MAG: hypothetical protein DMG76_23725 [Acidobacteriota bacterium]
MTFTSDGSVTNIQSIHDAQAADGDVIIVPTGTWTWSTTLTITKAITLQGQTMWSGGGTSEAGGVHTALVPGAIINFASNVRILSITSNASAHVVLSRLAFVYISGTATEWMLTGGNSPHPIIVHDCYFELTFTGANRCIDWQSSGGLFYNCTVWANPIGTDNTTVNWIRVLQDNVRLWESSPTTGTLDTGGNINLYIEDCTIYNCLSQTLDLDDGARLVVRKCQLFDTGSTAHGADSSKKGGRHIEYYDNTFTHTLGINGGATLDPNNYPQNLSWWYNMRGGTMIITRNAIPDNVSQWWGSKATWTAGDWAVQRGTNQFGCPLSYPSPYQAGWGSDGVTITNCVTSLGTFPITQSLEPIYIWANTVGAAANILSLNDWGTDSCGHGLSSAGFIQQGRDFILGPKPGYTSFTYPHPFRTQSTPPLEVVVSGTWAASALTRNKLALRARVTRF